MFFCETSFFGLTFPFLGGRLGGSGHHLLKNLPTPSNFCNPSSPLASPIHHTLDRPFQATHKAWLLLLVKVHLPYHHQSHHHMFPKVWTWFQFSWKGWLSGNQCIGCFWSKVPNNIALWHSRMLVNKCIDSHPIVTCEILALCGWSSFPEVLSASFWTGAFGCCWYGPGFLQGFQVNSGPSAGAISGAWMLDLSWICLPFSRGWQNAKIRYHISFQFKALIEDPPPAPPSIYGYVNPNMVSYDD